ncbi:hypothetical protein LTR49_024255 [Elasticomyces elasticus]|nr:hypothetical protein LTR49_024255 [Elasticomyces elasticus]
MFQVKQETHNEPEANFPSCLGFGADEIAWTDIAGLLNYLTRLQPITPRVLQTAQQRVWLETAGESKPLPEDFSIRGLVWTYFSFCPGWFKIDEDEDWLRQVETASTHRVRADRVLYHGLRLAFTLTAKQETPYLSYEPSRCTFSTSSMVTPYIVPDLQPLLSNRIDFIAARPGPSHNIQYSPIPSSPVSPASDSGHVHVRWPLKEAQLALPKTWATVARTARAVKSRSGAEDAKVFDSKNLHFDHAET